MTTNERVQAVIDYGFTEREARFLVLVMRHSGLCVKRQYAVFAGIASGGDRCNALFDKLVRRGFAVAVDCIHNRARLYHVHHKPLYHAIGEADNRYRRAVPARAAAERLMRLDAALIDPELDWLTARSEKVAYLAGRRASESSDPSTELPAQDTSDLFPGTFPIGIDAMGRAVLMYVVTRPWTDDFRSFLVGHLPLLAVMPTWTLRIVFPQFLGRVVPDYQRAVYEELESRLDSETVNDLQWYFFHTRRRTDWREYKGAGSDAIKARFARCLKAFAGPRFARLYRRWLTEREAALTSIPLAVSEAFTAGRGSLQCIVLPHDYEPFSPLVSRRHARRRQLTADAEGGDVTPRGINRSLNRFLNGSPAVHEQLTATEGRRHVSPTMRSGFRELRSSAAPRIGRRSLPPATGVPIAEGEPRT
jgi:hypothetical protein